MTGGADGEAALQLADEAFQRRDVDAVVAHLSAAVRGFTANGNKSMAAMACVRLGDVLANAIGNLTASRAWFARARRLIADEAPCIEQGWVAVAAMGCDVDDPAQLLADAELALDRARRFGDVNLETKALADAGLARVQIGDIVEGMRLLDEAMALACGPADDDSVAAKSVCSFFTACYVSCDYERVGNWTELLTKRGVLSWHESPSSVFLSSHCDSVRAALLVEMGRWTEAELVLVAARDRFQQALQAPSWHPDIGLAELRLRQGRLTEAEALLMGKEQSVAALLPFAQVSLARGDHSLAMATARRGLRAVGTDRLRAIELLIVVVDAALAGGQLDVASGACEELAKRTHAIGVAASTARSAAAQARTHAAAGDFETAIASLAPAVDELDPSKSAWLRTSLLFELAGLRRRAGDERGAELDTRQAQALLANLDVVAPSEWTAPPQSQHVRMAVLTEGGKWWTIAFGATQVRLADTKGLRYLAELIANSGAERHALDLVDRVEGVDPERVVDRRKLASAGELLDGAARTAYRRRIEALRQAAADAIETGQLESAEAIQDELDQLVGQLANAFGLGGRQRVAGSVSEKARLNVTRAIRASIVKITDALPAAGAALDRGVRTGVYCSYHPSPDEAVRWIVQS